MSTKQTFRKVEITENNETREEFIASAIIEPMLSPEADTDAEKKRIVSANLERFKISKVHAGEYVQEPKTEEGETVLEFVKATKEKAPAAPAPDAKQ